MGHLISEPKSKIPTSPPLPPPPLCLLVSDKSLRKSTKHSKNFSKKKKDKYDKNNSKAVFCLLKLLVYIQLVTRTRLSCNAQFSYWFPLFALFVEDL